MEQNILLNKIQGQINTLQLQIDSIASQPELIYRIDIESLKRNVIQLYDLLFQLKPVGTVYDDTLADTVTQESKQAAPIEVEVVPAPDFVIPQPENIVVADYFPSDMEQDLAEEASEVKPDEPFSFQIETESENIEEDVYEDYQHTDAPYPDSFKQQPVYENPVRSGFAPTLDLFDDSFPASLGETMATSRDMSIAGHMQQKKIDDLRSAIGINEKFLFINELFGGNLNQYNKTIEELNNFRSLSGAQTCLMELGVQHQWPPHSQALVKLKDLIERKF
jgi:hypothetical protein